MLRLVFAMIIMIFNHNEFLFLRWWWRTTMARTWCMVGRLCSSQSLILFVHSANIKTSKSSVARCFELWCGWSVKCASGLIWEKSFFLKICWQTLLPFPRATPYFLRMSSFIPWAPGGVKDFSQKLSNGICWHSIVKFTNNNCEIHYIQFWNSQA